MALILFVSVTFFADFIFTAGSPNLFASRAHEAHTSILSSTRPPSSVVTRYGLCLVNCSQRLQTNSMAYLLPILSANAFYNEPIKSFQGILKRRLQQRQQKARTNCIRLCDFFSRLSVIHMVLWTSCLQPLHKRLRSPAASD